VRRDGHDVDRASDDRRGLGCERAQPAAGLDERRQDPRRDPKFGGELEIPRATARIQQPGGRRVAELCRFDAGEPVVQQIGDQQHAVGETQQIALRRELEDRVEGQVLQAVARVQLRGGHPRVHCGDAGIAPRVAVVVGHAQRAAPAQQAVVDRPRVDADRDDLAGRLALGEREAGERLPVQLEQVPVQTVPRAHGIVREARHVLRAQPAAVDAAEDHAAARGSQIDGGDGGRAH
jgi:hypothetical protein